MKTYKVKVNGKVFEVELEAVSETKGSIAAPEPQQIAAPAPVSGGSAELKAPIAGKLIRFNVKVGDSVKKGDIVAVVEAMKLENEVPALENGKVVSLNVKPGDHVDNGTVIVTLG